MDFSDTTIFSTSLDLSDCQLKTVLRARPEFSLPSSDHHSDQDPDYEPAYEMDDEDSLAREFELEFELDEFHSSSSQNLTSDDGPRSEYEEFDTKGSCQKKQFKRMKMETQDDSQESPKALNSIWVVQAAEVFYNSWKKQRVVDEKIVGSFSSKSDAMETCWILL